MTAPVQLDLFESRRRRDEGRNRAASRHADWLEHARDVAEEIARFHGFVNADMLRSAGIVPPQDASPNIMGAVFADRNRFEIQGFTQSARPVAHANLLRVWVLKQGPAVSLPDEQGG